MVWHLVPGVHHGYGGYAIGEGDADEHMPAGSREVRVRDATSSPLPVVLMAPDLPKGPPGPDPPDRGWSRYLGLPSAPRLLL